MLRLIEMVEKCFGSNSLSKEEEEDHAFDVHTPCIWFKQPPRDEKPHHQPFAQTLAGHTSESPEKVIRQLVSKANDLPACLFFYPIAGQPHSIQDTWLASGSEIYHNFMV